MSKRIDLHGSHAFLYFIEIWKAVEHLLVQKSPPNIGPLHYPKRSWTKHTQNAMSHQSSRTMSLDNQSSGWATAAGLKITTPFKNFVTADDKIPNTLLTYTTASPSLHETHFEGFEGKWTKSAFPDASRNGLTAYVYCNGNHSLIVKGLPWVGKSSQDLFPRSMNNIDRLSTLVYRDLLFGRPWMKRI